MSAAPKLFRLEGAAADPDASFTLESIREANLEDPEIDPVILGQLKVGQTLTFGGGAAPLVLLRRVR